MKAIVLASAMTVVMMLVQTVELRYRRPTHRARQMTVVFGSAWIALPILWWATPDDLGVLPPWLLTEPRWIDLVAMQFYFTAAFFGGALQLYNLADRGLSLRVLIDMVERPEGVWSADRVVKDYSCGQGLHWMYDKRMRDLLAHDLLSVRDGVVLLTGRGRRSAALFLALRRLFRLEN
jgi:hypothetical protein